MTTGKGLVQGRGGTKHIPSREARVENQRQNAPDHAPTYRGAEEKYFKNLDEAAYGQPTGTTYVPVIIGSILPLEVAVPAIPCLRKLFLLLLSLTSVNGNSSGLHTQAER